ncbi:MAG: 6-carboxytetrahydropterin synthase QueD [Deltaproteobacteria bacterium]|nr:MAG: 6-carboxytetrahydropterin synthase QueD [Deltaproteobacteria bacterium]
MFELMVTTNFAAAHQLRMVGNKCENLHGHNWKVEVYVSGDKLDNTGLLIDFGELKRHLGTIIENLDHRFLNEMDFFKNENPSSERIAVFIANKLAELIEGTPAKVSRVRVWESDNACVTYLP